MELLELEPFDIWGTVTQYSLIVVIVVEKCVELLKAEAFEFSSDVAFKLSTVQSIRIVSLGVVVELVMGPKFVKLPWVTFHMLFSPVLCCHDASNFDMMADNRSIKTLSEDLEEGITQSKLV